VQILRLKIEARVQGERCLGPLGTRQVHLILRDPRARALQRSLYGVVQAKRLLPLRSGDEKQNRRQRPAATRRGVSLGSPSRDLVEVEKRINGHSGTAIAR
jgi:hypothetical protein